MTVINREWRDKYDELTDEDRRVIDNAFGRLAAYMREEGFSVPGDDRTEDLIGAITKFYCESTPPQ